MTAAKLDDKGRCCGRKPLSYRHPSPYFFCPRCDREYNPDGDQIENWAWEQRDGEFQPRERLITLKRELTMTPPSMPDNKRPWIDVLRKLGQCEAIAHLLRFSNGAHVFGAYGWTLSCSPKSNGTRP